jgi:DNA-binding NarL/FixJ family response regulator
MLKILAQILKALGDFVLVGAATDGRQALRSVLALSPDLVLMDFHLPGLNGIQATEYIKRFEQPPVIVVITSDDSSASRSLALKAGADAFVVKGGNLRERLSDTLCGLFAAGAHGRKKSRRVFLRTPPEGRTAPPAYTR